MRGKIGPVSYCGCVCVVSTVLAFRCAVEVAFPCIHVWSWLRNLNMAEYVISSLLRPDGTVQTTSQVSLDQLPNFINGNEMQLFVQTHGLVHLRNVLRTGGAVTQLNPQRQGDA